jgi:hypothetical protein
MKTKKKITTNDMSNVVGPVIVINGFPFPNITRGGAVASSSSSIGGGRRVLMR